VAKRIQEVSGAQSILSIILSGTNLPANLRLAVLKEKPAKEVSKATTSSALETNGLDAKPPGPRSDP
jgi:hypothetical protein